MHIDCPQVFRAICLKILEISFFSKNPEEGGSAQFAGCCRWRMPRHQISVRFEVFTVVTMESTIFWDVIPCT
jgi:hypothetical protein